MLMVSSFELVLNKETGIYTIIPEKDNPCPLCGGALKYRNRRIRSVRSIVGEKSRYLLRRLWCASCRKLHTEFPDTIQPYKHYDTDTIQHAIDDSEEALVIDADDTTIRRWRKEYADSQAEIEQELASVYARETGATVPIHAASRLLPYIRTSIRRWLAYVTRLLINSGHRVRTRFAFCPAPPAAKMGLEDTIQDKGGKQHDQTIEGGTRGGDGTV